MLTTGTLIRPIENSSIEVASDGLPGGALLLG
jgi:hypothetical protein